MSSLEVVFDAEPTMLSVHSSERKLENKMSCDSSCIAPTTVDTILLASNKADEPDVEDRVYAYSCERKSTDFY